MNLLVIAAKSIRQRWLASGLTSLSVSLGVMLMVAVLAASQMAEAMFRRTATGYDLIIGPKGSPLELVLSTVFRMSVPDEPLPYRFYRELVADSGNGIEDAVPVTLGDVTERGAFPIMGTTPQYFTLPYMYNQETGQPVKFAIRDRSLDESIKSEGLIRNPFDACIGATVAVTNDWDVGSKLKLRHGGAEGDHVHDDLFTVVGVLARTGTPNDRTVFINIEGFFLLEGHDKPIEEAIAREIKLYGDVKMPPEGFKGIPDLQKEVTAILVNMKGESGGQRVLAMSRLKNDLNEGARAQAVEPATQIDRLMRDLVGPMKSLVLVLTGLIIAVSGISIFVSIYNSMADRRKEIAIMRALGARRQTVLGVILAESTLLCVTGGVVGFLLGHLLIIIGAPFAERYQLVIDPWSFSSYELVLLPALVVLASLVGFIPGMTAYRTDVARTLSD